MMDLLLGTSSDEPAGSDDECTSHERRPEIPDQTSSSYIINTHPPNKQLFGSTSGSERNNTELLILAELKKTNETIGALSDRLNAVENGLKSLEQQQKEALLSPASSSSCDSTKRKVSSKTRVSFIIYADNYS